MKLVFAFNIIVHAAQNSSNKVDVCEGQCQDPAATCTEGGENGFVCNCPQGFSWITQTEWNPAGWTGYCEDIDECIEGVAGYVGDEICNADGNNAYVCVNLVGSFTCGCNSGYQLDTDIMECKDINECAEGISGCEYGCTNFVGSFECSNPCEGKCNDLLAICEVSYTNLHYFECSCLDGYTWDDAVDACIDIDECATGGIGADICNAGAFCENTIGGFHCGCTAGENQGKI